MEDTQIISLFFQRSDNAIAEVQSKYDRLAKSVARRILPDERDVEECVSDAYMRLWDAIPPNKPQSLSAYLMRIVRNVSLDKYNYNTAEKRSTALYSAPIRQILVTIDASIDGDLSLKRFANELFLNTSYLSSLFKKETGMTLTDYVNQHRVNFAKRLLKSTTLSIQAVATAVGISDIHYFTRLFRRETGYSPREYRKL